MKKYKPRADQVSIGGIHFTYNERIFLLLNSQGLGYKHIAYESRHYKIKPWRTVDIVKQFSVKVKQKLIAHDIDFDNKASQVVIARWYLLNATPETRISQINS